MTTAALPGVDLPKFEQWVTQTQLLNLTGPLTAQVIPGGLSNLSYTLTDGHQRWVLRRPPLGHVLSTAHDMGREVRVMRALNGTAVPVPIVRIHHRDEDGRAGIGAEFSIVDFVDGVVIRSAEQTNGMSREQITSLGPELVRVLARLHEIDPVAAGLEGFGRPGGFLERQVSRWRRQLDQSRNRELPRLDELASRVATSIPTTLTTGIVHGDYRLDNTMMRVASGQPTLVAVLDWEMSTLGDVLTDLGLLEVYWNLHDIPESADSPLASAIDPSAGFVSAAELLDEYAHERGIAVPADLGWYSAFASFKLAVILEGIHARHLMGHTVGEGFDRVGALVTPLADRGLARLNQEL